MIVNGNIETKVSHEFKKVFLNHLTQPIQDGMGVTLKQRMIPKLNKIITDSRAYLELIPGILLDASLQTDPVVDQSYMGFKMTGLFSPVNGTDLEPKELELNSTEPIAMSYLYNSNGGNLQLYLHQLSLDSLLASYLKRHQISSWMRSQQLSSEDNLNLTTSGLNDVFIEEPVLVTLNPPPADPKKAQGNLTANSTKGS